MSRKRLSWRHLLRVTTTPWVVITSVGIDLPRNWRLPAREALKNPARDFHLVSPGRRTIIGGRRWYCWWNGVGRGRQWSRGSAIVEVKFWNLNGVKDIGSSDHGKKVPEVLCPWRQYSTEGEKPPEVLCYLCCTLLLAVQSVRRKSTSG